MHEGPVILPFPATKGPFPEVAYDLFGGGRVLVTGGRANYDWSLLWDALDVLQPRLLIEGGAHGWDEGAYRWAEHHHVKLRTVNAPWESMGKAAGHQRNLWMLDALRPSVVLVGRGGDGTAHCVAAARERGIPILKLYEY